MARDLAIDLGTANTLVYAKGKGIVLNQPTVIALNTRTHEVLAVGNEAWQMIGRTPGYIVAVRPLRQGAITDFDITERMIRLLLHRAGVTKLNRPRVLICVPSAITSVERRAVKEAARRAGASAAYLIEQPMAAAIGAGLAIHEPMGNMVVDVGGGTAETAVISLGGVVASRAIRCGGFDMDAAIQPYVRHEYGVAIGERTAEELKLAIGSALPYADEVQGRGARPRGDRPGCPRRWSCRPTRSARPSSDQVDLIVATVIDCLGEAPPELAQDIIYQGIHLVGGGAMLRGLANRLANETEVPVHLVDTPLECVVLGAGRASTPSTACAPLRRRRGLSRAGSPPVTPRPAGPRPPGGPASPGRRGSAAGRPRPRVRRRRPGPRPPAGGRPACRRGRPARPGSPAGSPMAPRAATAASRHSGSGWPPSTGGQRGQGGDRAGVALLPEGPGRHLHHRRVGVVEDRRPRRPPGRVGRQLAGPTAHRRVGVDQGGGQVGVVQAPEPGQGAEGGGPHRRRRGRRARPGRRPGHRCGRPGPPAGAGR